MPSATTGRGPVLLVSSGGGHFTELSRIVRGLRLHPDEEHWAVPRTTQSEVELAGHPHVTWLPEVNSRGLAGALRNLGVALRLHRTVRPRLVLTAGAAQAVPHLLVAAGHRTRIRYVESVARVEAPSMTGRLAAVLPTAELHAPVSGWGRGWVQQPDVFDGFAATDGGAGGRGALVALGSERFPFARAVAAARAVLPAESEVTWQVGHTDAADPAGVQLNRWLRPDEMARVMGEASVVIVHGGAGSVLTALGAGKVPVVLPRSAAAGEHVDDHQQEMCDRLERRGLAIVVRPGEALTAAHLTRAAGLRAIDRHRDVADISA